MFPKAELQEEREQRRVQMEQAQMEQAQWQSVKQQLKDEVFPHNSVLFDAQEPPGKGWG